MCRAHCPGLTWNESTPPPTPQPPRTTPSPLVGRPVSAAARFPRLYMRLNRHNNTVYIIIWCFICAETAARNIADPFLTLQRCCSLKRAVNFFAYFTHIASRLCYRGIGLWLLSDTGLRIWGVKIILKKHGLQDSPRCASSQRPFITRRSRDSFVYNI